MTKSCIKQRISVNPRTKYSGLVFFLNFFMQTMFWLNFRPTHRMIILTIATMTWMSILVPSICSIGIKEIEVAAIMTGSNSHIKSRQRCRLSPLQSKYFRYMPLKHLQVLLSDGSLILRLFWLFFRTIWSLVMTWLPLSVISIPSLNSDLSEPLVYSECSWVPKKCHIVIGYSVSKARPFSNSEFTLLEGFIINLLSRETLLLLNSS